MSSNPVGIYQCPLSLRSVLAVVLTQQADSATIVVGKGIKGSSVRVVPSATVRLIPGKFTLSATSDVTVRHMADEVAPQLLSNPTQDAADTTLAAIGRTADEGSIRMSPVVLLQRMLVSPFDCITQWTVPPMTAAFVCIAFVVFFTRNASWLLQGVPLVPRVVGDESLFTGFLLVLATLLAIASSFDALDATDGDRLQVGNEDRSSRPRKSKDSTDSDADGRTPAFGSSSAIMWRWAALVPLIVVTAVDTIHRDWSAASQSSSRLGQLVSVVYPWLAVSVDEICLYTAAAIAIVRRMLH